MAIKKNKSDAPKATAKNMCEKMGFAASESYKLLRTNLMFSFGNTGKCKIVGVTSGERGEGKSTTAINLAYTFAETGKQVVLIDADMRLPSVSAKLGIRQAPGLSNRLAGLTNGTDTVLQYKEMQNFHIIPAGDIPPNPSELLASETMHKILEALSQQVDFIVIDLPPVNLVADALAISQWIDGLIITVRQEAASRKSVEYCMNQLSVIRSKILGFVLNDVVASGSRYGKYKKYGYGYGAKPETDTDKV